MAAVTEAAADAPNAPGGPPEAAAREEESLGSLLRPDALAVWSWVLGYTAFLTSLSVLRFHLWLSTGWDLGLYQQGLWLLMHRGLTAISTYTGHPLLADQGAFVLLPLAPFFAAGGVGLLLLLQSFALGVGYLLVRRIAETLGSGVRTAHILGALYLIYPTVLGSNLFDFHPDVLAVPVLLGATLAYLRRRPWAFAVLSVLAVCANDTVPLVLAVVGVVQLWERRPSWGVPTLAGSLLAAYLDIHVLIPRVFHAGMMSQWAFYANLGPTPSSGLAHVLRHPALLLDWMHRSRAWEYLGWLMLPFAGLVVGVNWRVANRWWLPGLVLAEANLLSPQPALTSPFTEVSLLAVPFFFTAAGAGVAAGAGRMWSRRKAAAWMAPPLLLLAVFVWQQHRTNWRPIPADAAVLEHAVAATPPRAPLVAPNNVLPHAATRAQEWLPAAALAVRLPKGTYVLLDASSKDPFSPPAAVSALRRALSAKDAAKVRFHSGPVTLFKTLRTIGPLQGAGSQR